MKTIAATDLGSRLDSCLRMVKGGQEILVTQRGMPVAKIVPFDEVVSHPESLLDLERRGLVQLGTGRLPRGFWKLPRGRDTKASPRRRGRQKAQPCE